MFYIEPTSGLCNRLRVIQSAYYLAQETGQNLTVVWNCIGGMNIPMEQLFTLPQNIQCVSFDYVSSNRIVYLLKQKKYKIYCYLKKHNNSFLFIDEQEMFNIKKANEESKIVDYLKSNKNVYIKTCSELADLDKCDIFIPSQQVLTKLSEVQEYCNVDHNTIGIHIRRTDNKQSILHSPTYLFESRIAERIEQDADAKFYLATDSIEEEKRLKEIFGDAIITFDNKDTSRNTFQGQVDAYVELLMLSKCGELWGSYYSSFSEIAARIGQIKFERIMKE